MMLPYMSVVLSMSVDDICETTHPQILCCYWAYRSVANGVVVTRLQKESQLMSNFIIRVANSEDQVAVAELCRRELLPADTTDNAGLDRLLWDTSSIFGYVAESKEIIVGAIFGSTTQGDDGSISGSIALIVVDANHTRQGIGTALLAGLELKLHSLQANEIWTGGGQPRFWWPGIDENLPGVINFFENAGYTREETVSNMRVTFENTDLEPRSTGRTLIRRLTKAEWPVFREWMDRTWKGQWGAEVETTLNRSPISCFVASLDNEYIGFAAYDTNRLGLFGPMGTSPLARGTGLGSELLRHCLREYIDQGKPDCDIGWVGPMEFYEKAVGASVSSSFARLRKV